MIEHRDLNYWKNLIGKYDLSVSKTMLDMNERTKLSEALLDGLRHFVEAVMCYIREANEPKEFIKRYDEITESKKYCKRNTDLLFIAHFDDNLNGSIGHQDVFGEYAERLFIKYYATLIKIKDLFKKKYSILILSDLNRYPLDLDNSFLDYYRVILRTISAKDINNDLSGCDSFYIQKKKMLYIDDVVFYEYTLTNAIDNINRFDRFIAFSLFDIPSNYAFKGRMLEKRITFLGQSIDYQIIVGYKVAIRPCELEKLSQIMGLNFKFNRSKEYWNLMSYIEQSHVSINRIVEFTEEDYSLFLKTVFINSRETALYKLIQTCHEFIQKTSEVGQNVLRYLLFKMNNVILTNQLPKDNDDCLSTINLSKGVYGFDRLPFSTYPLGHIPSMRDLLKVYSFSDHKEEILAKTLRDYSIDESCIYISKDKINMSDIDIVIKDYNSNFHRSSLEDRKIYEHGNYIFLKENETNTKNVLEKLLSHSNTINFPDYENYIENQIIEKNLSFSDSNKELALRKMYIDSSVFAVYGAAGSGKSYFANYVLHALDDIIKVCIASTNPAVDNMKRRFDDNSAQYLTINKYLKEYSNDSNIDLLVIDECSTISSRDMRDILTKTSPKLILLLGDTYQIKPISFGNWYSLLRKFLKDDSFIDLNNQYRSNSEVLLGLWNEVRNLGKNIQELLDTNEISHRFDKSIFEKNDNDEIILCLNYDGLYGINNLNKVLQKNNPNKEVKWKQYIFKVNDPIIFDDSYLFKGVFYNNLKGTILNISEEIDRFVFTVKIKRVVNPLICQNNNVTFIRLDGNESVVSFEVRKYGEDYYDNDTSGNTHFPFQIAYALSIHKAQGLEYNSVKIIISNEVEENVTHSVFYTAITRAKKTLNIYWTPETENKIISSFYIDNCDNDANIISARFPELRKENNTNE